jgi:hypothetical protein
MFNVYSKFYRETSIRKENKQSVSIISEQPSYVHYRCRFFIHRIYKESVGEYWFHFVITCTKNLLYLCVLYSFFYVIGLICSRVDVYLFVKYNSRCSTPNSTKTDTTYTDEETESKRVAYSLTVKQGIEAGETSEASVIIPSVTVAVIILVIVAICIFCRRRSNFSECSYCYAYTRTIFIDIWMI